MVLRILFILIFIMCSVLLIAQEKQKLFLSESDYSINWYEQAEFTKDSSILNDMVILSNNWTLEVDDEEHPNSKYFIAVEEYPSNYIHSDSSIVFLDATINSTQNPILSDEEFELLSSNEIVLNNYFGKEFRWKNSNNNIYFRMHVYIFENYLFQIGVINRLGKNHNTFSQEFFDSFKLSNSFQGKYVKSSKEYKQSYTVDFPSEPSYTTSVVDSEMGKITMHLMMLEDVVDDVNGLYMTNEAEYPTHVINESNAFDLNKFYISSINGSINAMNADLISIHNIKYNSHVGKEFKSYLAEGELILTYRIYLINNILYNLGVATTPENDNNASMIQFFDSFKIK